MIVEDVGDQLNRMADSLLLWSSVCELRNHHGLPPNIDEYRPQTKVEHEEHLFNLSRHCPEDIDEPSAIANWILQHSHLNPSQLALFLAEDSHNEVLHLLTEAICARCDGKNVVECLRSFLLTTGAVAIIYDMDNHGPATLKLLRCFAKSFITMNGSEFKDISNAEFVADLCVCIISMSFAILQGHEVTSLPDFFAAGRAIAQNTALPTGIFSQHKLTDIFNQLKDKGPYQSTASSQPLPSYLFTSWNRCDWIRLSFSISTDVPKDRYAITTHNAVYLFYDNEKFNCYECLPLRNLRVVPCEHNILAVEVMSLTDGEEVPFFKFDADSSTLQYHSTVILQIKSMAEHAVWLDTLERVVWTCATS